MIKQHIVDKIYELPLMDVIGKHIELKKAGVNYTACCPFHDEKTPSFVVSPAKGIYKCYGCGKGGNNAIKFLSEYKNLEWFEAVKQLAADHNIDLEFEDDDPKQKEHREQTRTKKAEIYHTLGVADEIFIQNMKNHQPAAAYANSRFTDEEIETWHIGWADGKLRQKMFDKGITENQMLEAGLLSQKEGRTYDFFINRLMFPGMTPTGKVCCFSGRIIQKESKYPKYLNSRNNLVFNKSSFLYGMHRAAAFKEQKIFIVEGSPDVIAMQSIGLFTVCGWGTSLNAEQFKPLRRFDDRIFVYDGDSAGLKALRRNGDAITEEQMSASVVVLPTGQDPYDFCKSSKPE